MCRMLAYVGPEVRLDALIERPPHSLVVQSYKPAETITSNVNADGFGVAWYPAGGGDPCVVTSSLPIWADRNIRELGRTISASRVLASVRNATPDMPVGPEAVQPFSRGPILFMHNGFVQNFRHGIMRRLRDSLDDAFYVAIETTTDSEHLFALFLNILARRGPGPRALGTALLETVAQIEAWTKPEGLAALLNVIASDGRTIVACRHATLPPSPSLYVAEDLVAFPSSVIIASEPIVPSEGWRPVPEGSLLEVDMAGRVTIEPFA
jgi:ergothioneine biosynthesis protein EgtC